MLSPLPTRLPAVREFADKDLNLPGLIAEAEFIHSAEGARGVCQPCDGLFAKTAVRAAKFGPTLTVEPVSAVKLPMTLLAALRLPTVSVPPAPIEWPSIERSSFTE